MKEELKRVSQESAEFFANFFSIIGRRLIERYGEEGKALLREGCREFGLARGRSLRARVEELGLQPDLENFTAHYNLPMKRAWRAEREETATHRHSRISFCPFWKFWEQQGVADIGLIYCDEVDPAIREGYSNALKHENLQNPLRTGGDICEQRDEYTPE